MVKGNNMGDRVEERSSINLNAINDMGWEFLANGYIETLFPAGRWERKVYKPLNHWRGDRTPGSFVIDFGNRYAKDFASDFYTKRSPVLYSYGRYGLVNMSRQEYANMSKELASIAGITSACACCQVDHNLHKSPQLQKLQKTPAPAPQKPVFNPVVADKVVMCRKRRIVENDEGEFVSKPVLLTYEYVRGYLVCRMPDEQVTGKDGTVKTKKDFRPQFYCEDERTWMFKDPPNTYSLPLYKLDNILSDQEYKKILVGEGEKVADFLQFTFPNGIATTSSHGARSARKTNWEATRGHEVIIFPDHDDAGVNYALDVAELCQQAGAKKIKIVMYEHDDGWDVVDALSREEILSGISREIVIDDKAPQHTTLKGDGCLEQLKNIFKSSTSNKPLLLTRYK